MESIKIISAAVFRQQQRRTQTFKNHLLGFSVGGLDYMNMWLPDGRLLFQRRTAAPFLFLALPGAKIDFSYSSQRENWVIELDIEGLRGNTERKNGIWQTGASQFAVPLELEPPTGDIPELQLKFARVVDLMNSGLPQNIAAAEFLSGALFANFLIDTGSDRSNDPAERFKAAIDHDTGFRLSLEEISSQLGWSSTHLRIQFQKRWQLPPVEYRTRLRLNAVMHLIVNTEYSLKEIAGRVGMKHLSHLYSLLKRHYRMTPKEMIRQYRNTPNESIP